MFDSLEERKRTDHSVRFVLALPIFPVRLQTSIFGRNELNFRVRYGNGCTLCVCNTNSSMVHLQGFEPGTH